MRILHLVVILAATILSEAQYYPRQLDCSPFQPPACTNTFLEGSDGKLNYTAPYEETCTQHACAVPDVHTTQYAWTDTAPGSQPQQVDPWFCSGASINYRARVATGMGLPPGKLEDQLAACAFANLRFGLLREDCRDAQLWTCDDCLRAYKAWLCSSLFPRCVTTAVDDGVVKPCLDLCWAASNRCPATQGLACPVNGELGDYTDGAGAPECMHPPQQATQTLLPADTPPMAELFALAATGTGDGLRPGAEET